jgi:CubicO group peptidase (beta-lactamase class C family)
MTPGQVFMDLLTGVIACCMCCTIACRAATPRAGAAGDPQGWPTIEPAAAGMTPGRLETLWNELRQRKTTALLVIREDRIVFERYAPGWSRNKPHYTASLAKALVGGVSLMLAMNDGRIKPDDLASRFVPSWTNDPRKAKITIRLLATHTSGIEDAEADALPHDQLTGWKGDFWKRLAPPNDPFTRARDSAPVLDLPGTQARYSNPGMAVLAYCITASLRGTTNAELRSLLKHRIMGPLAVPDSEWSIGYGAATSLEGMDLFASWGGAAFSPYAAARVGLLMLHQGTWEGQELISHWIVDAATTHADMPNNSGLGWWVNREADGRKHWPAAPQDAFWGAGAGHQFLLVIPSLNLIVVRTGELLDETLSFDNALETCLVALLMKAFPPNVGEPYPPSRVIKQMAWSPAKTILRKGRGSDNWPLTWADDDALYTAYGDGGGFEPGVDEKLSLGFAKVTGSPPDFSGTNIRSATGEHKGDGKAGIKASGLLMVEGVLYLWGRNAGNSQLAWSMDHARTWTWSDWKFTTSFGCPTFLNFGPNYAGARDGFVYVYSHDADSAYQAADRFVLARVPKDQIRNREAYELFKATNTAGQPVWTQNLQERGSVFAQPGRCYRSTVSYNPALRRYLWCQTLPGEDPRTRGGFGIYDAPEPWGPWTTVYFTEQWDVGPGETSAFPTKWIGHDGRTLYLVFSGLDSFAVRKAVVVPWGGH